MTCFPLKTKMKRYTKEQKQECVDYLNYSCKEGYIDESLAEALIRTRSWEAIYELMARGDDWANNNENYENAN